MTILSANDIREKLKSGQIIVKRNDGKEPSINMSSVDIHLSGDITTFKFANNTYIDSAKLTDPVVFEQMRSSGVKMISHNYTDEYLGLESFYVHRNDTVFGNSIEKIELPDNIGARFYQISSLMRLGLNVESAASWASWIDPGFKGDLRLRLSNMSWLPIKLERGTIIGRLVFETVGLEDGH